MPRKRRELVNVGAKTSLLGQLNPAQREAAIHRGGPLLVVAGPGTGKTRVLTTRVIERILSDGVPERRVLAITFTNAAAREMRLRLEAGLGNEMEVRVGTFHYVCGALLRRYASYLNYRQNFNILSPAGSRNVLQATLDAYKLPSALRLRDVAHGVSLHKNGASLEDASSRAQLPPEQLHRIENDYANRLVASNAVDVDDLLALAVRLLSDESQVRDRCRQAYEEILVDEYQDTNRVQRRILQLLLPSSNSLVAVGDDDQAIYSWRQADARALLDFPSDFRGAHTVFLDETYRSTKSVLRVSGRLIEHNHDRLPKKLHTRNPAGKRSMCFIAADENDEARLIADEIRRTRNTGNLQWSDFAVIYRLNVQARALEDVFLQGSIPYRVRAGRRFYELPGVQLCTAYLKLLLDATDPGALLTLLSSLRGIATRRIEMISNLATDTGRPLIEVVRTPGDIPGLPSPARAQIEMLLLAIESLKEFRRKSLVEQVDAAVAAACADIHSRVWTEAVSTLEIVRELHEVAQEAAARRSTLRDLVDRLVLTGETEADSDAVVLMTMHASKGTEFPVVFVAGVEEGIVPHKRAHGPLASVDEERRLLYVGMTRAQHQLYLSYAQTRRRFQSAEAGGPSPFIAEIGISQLKTFVSPAARRKPRLFEVRCHDRVHHLRWGKGTVITMTAGGKDAMVIIDFDEVGTKRLQLRYAPLSKVVAPGNRR